MGYAMDHNDIINRLIELYEEDSNGGGYFDLANGIGDMNTSENSQQTNTPGDIVVMTHVATTVAQAALGFIRDAARIFDEGVDKMDTRFKGDDVEEFVELIADNPLGLKFCTNNPILVP